MKRKRPKRTLRAVSPAAGQKQSAGNTQNSKASTPAQVAPAAVYSGQTRLGNIQQCHDGTWLAIADDETLIGYFATAQLAARAFGRRRK